MQTKNIIVALTMIFIISLAAKAESLTVCVPDFEPWGMTVQGKVQGIMLDHVVSILNEVKIKGVADFANYPRMIQRLRDGDCEIGVFSRYEKNADAVEFIEHVYDLQVVVVTPKDVVIENYETFHDLKRIPSIGFPLGGDGFFVKLFNDPKIVKSMVPTQQHGVMMLANGRLGAFVRSEKTIQYEIKKNNFEMKINFPGLKVDKLEIWLQVSKKSKKAMALVPQLRKAAKDLKKNGTYESVINQWVSARP